MHIAVQRKIATLQHEDGATGAVVIACGYRQR